MGFDTERAIAHAERVATKQVVRRLRDQLGIWQTGRVLARVLLAKLRGEPFKQLGPARDERDRLSRRQAAGVVLLDRALRSLAPPEIAREVVREAVMAGALPFLESMVPLMAPERLAEQAEELAGRFFNAEGAAELESATAFRFDVTCCRFVDLLGAIHESHLAPLFCEADQTFFDGVRRKVVLTRTRTLATGGTTCDFRFRVS